MNKRLQGLIAGVLIGAMLTGGTAFAKQANEMVKIFYNNIKIYIDGGEIVPKDATGKIVEPFIMNGTTYLPVRAVSNAFGKDVEWDGKTQSVYVGKKDQTRPDEYLNKLQYNDYKEGSGRNDFTVINGTVTDYSNNVYTNGIMLYVDRHSDAINEDSDGAESLIAYPLNSQYTNLKGNIVLPKSCDITSWGKKDNLNAGSADVFFYGDGKLLYKATYVTNSMPFSFGIDVRGVNQLTIKIKADDYIHAALCDLALYK